MNQVNVPAASSGTPFPRTPQIIFGNWREALHHSGLSSAIQTAYCMAVQGYLDYCAHNAISVTRELSMTRIPGPTMCAHSCFIANDPYSRRTDLTRLKKTKNVTLAEPHSRGHLC